MTALTASIVIGLALSCAPGIDPAIVAGIATAESHLDPSAVHINTDGSRDIGLMQINDRNFACLGLTPQTALDPCQSIRSAAQLLQSYSRYNTGSPVAGFINQSMSKFRFIFKRHIARTAFGRRHKSSAGSKE